MTQTHLIVLTASQIFKTKSVNASIAEFAEKTGKAELSVSIILAESEGCSGSKVISRYKSGEIKRNKDFFELMRGELGTELSDDDIRYCWNKMCEFSSESSREVQDVCKFLLANPNVIMVCVSETNLIHKQYNDQQFLYVLQEAKIEEPKNLYFINSHELGMLNKTDLFRKGVDEYRLPLDEVSLVTSLHRDMPANQMLVNVGEREIKYQNIATSPDSNIAQLLESTKKRSSEQREQEELASDEQAHNTGFWSRLAELGSNICR